MNDDGIDEVVLETMRDSFLVAMSIQPNENIPEIAYAVLEALVKRVGPDNFRFIEEVLAECIVVASGLDKELH